MLWDHSTDGCSAPKRIKPHLPKTWKEACQQHDFRYRNGTISRQEADEMFWADLRRLGGRASRFGGAWLAWRVVSIFGKKHFNYEERERYLARRRTADEQMRMEGLEK